MKLTIRGWCFAAIGVLGATLLADAPAPVKSVMPVNEMELEIAAQVARLEKSLASQAAFDKEKGTSVRQGFGVLALLGQGLAEHADKTTSKINAAALRDGALVYKRNSAYAEAQTALKQVKDSVTGGGPTTAGPNVEWNRLIGLGALMHEINDRNEGLKKIVDDGQKGPDAARQASLWAAMSLAMQADTHEVKNPADLPKWNQFVLDFRESSIKLAAAIREGNKAGAQEGLVKTQAACAACHKVFHPEQ